MDFYGTIGPACADVKLLQQMVEAVSYTHLTLPTT